MNERALARTGTSILYTISPVMAIARRMIPAVRPIAGNIFLREMK